MDKMKLAHEFMLAMIKAGCSDGPQLLERAWQYADAMQAEADKRKPSGLPDALKKEWQHDIGKDRWTTSFKVAVDLVSDAGIEYAKFLLEDGNPYITVRLDGEDRKYIVFANDLKRLVDSHAVVEQSGGLEKAKKELQQPPISEWMIFEQDALRQAIADVESCQ